MRETAWLSSLLVVLLLVEWTFPAALSAGNAGDALDQGVIKILRAKCVMCHDEQGASAGGGVDNLLRLDELASGYLDRVDRKSSELLNIVSGEPPRMPQKKEGAWNGPLTNDELEQLRQWVLRGGPSPEYLASRRGQNRPLITDQDIYQQIVKDLVVLNEDAQNNARYLTLFNLHNNRDVSHEDLDTYRAGMVKTLNSLSRAPEILGLDTSKAANRVVAVDQTRTLFRFDLRHIGWKAEDWDRVAQHDPYSLVPKSQTATLASKLTETVLPVLRADWFVFATLQPPLYHDLVGIPQTLEQLEKSLGIDRLQEIRTLKTQRAGMTNSHVSENNRLIERMFLKLWAGGYHISYDYASNSGKQNLLDNPLGPPGAFETDHAFQHDGGEVIFSLRNGFQAYALVTADGKRLDIAPQHIVSDPEMPGGVIINGISCLSCHYQGMKPEAGSSRLKSLDEVRTAVLDDRRSFSRAERDLVASLYPPPEKFAELIDEDRQRFVDALNQAGIAQNGTEEPARALFDRFVKDLDLDTVAAELGLSPEDCEARMNRESETRKLLQRIKRGTLKRQLLIAELPLIVRLTGVGDAREFAQLPFPYFGEKVVPGSKNVSVAAAPAKVFTGVDLIDAEHRSGALQVQIRTEGERRSYVDDESIRLHVRTTEDCYLTIVAVDPVGDVTLLLPNKWHPDFQLKGGQTVTLPTREMGFEFFATEPHGRTIIKAIATKRPLHLKNVDADRLRGTELVPLGNIETFGGQRGIGLRERVSEPQPAPLANQATHTHLTDKVLDELFLPNEWGTALWTMVTGKK